MNDIVTMWYLWTPFILGAIVGWLWPSATRRAIFIVLFGVPTMLLGYLFGYIQAGFMTGYHFYLRDRG
jgi:hypothetical protein